MSKKMKLKVDGKEVEGTAEQLLELLQKQVAEENNGPKYFSESKDEFVPIKKMADEHLMNAVIKHGKFYLESLRGLSLQDFEIEFENAFRWHAQNYTVGVLLQEIARRNNQ